MSTISWFTGFLYSQFLITPPKPTRSFEGQTVIVTGSNTGLGMEAARHLTRLRAAKVILAVRTTSKGEAAKSSIEESTGRHGVVEVWSLDLSSYESVKQFAHRATNDLDRVDVLLENAGMTVSKFTVTEQDESTVTTNVVSTFLLALLLLPKMRETSQRFNTIPRLTVVSSDLHFTTNFPEKNAGNIFEALNDKDKADMSDRYGATKLLEVLLLRHLAGLLSASSKPQVVINTLTPGFCQSDFLREARNRNYIINLLVETVSKVVGRTTEVGSRTLVAAAAAGEESHGQYMADGVVSYVSPFVLSDEGKAVGEKVWAELVSKLDKVSPGVGRIV